MESAPKRKQRAKETAPRKRKSAVQPIAPVIIPDQDWQKVLDSLINVLTQLLPDEMAAWMIQVSSDSQIASTNIIDAARDFYRRYINNDIDIRQFSERNQQISSIIIRFVNEKAIEEMKCREALTPKSRRSSLKKSGSSEQAMPSLSLEDLDLSNVQLEYPRGYEIPASIDIQSPPPITSSLILYSAPSITTAPTSVKRQKVTEITTPRKNWGNYAAAVYTLATAQNLIPSSNIEPVIKQIVTSGGTTVSSNTNEFARQFIQEHINEYFINK